MSREAKHQVSSEILEDGSIALKAVFADGAERNFTLPVWNGSELSSTLLSYAAAGLEAKLKSFLNGGGVKDFDDYAPLLTQGPDVRRPRAGSTAVKLDALGLAVQEVFAAAGKTLSDAKVKEFLGSKSKEERAAIRNDARVAPVYARIKAAQEAAALAKKGETKADLLSDLDIDE